MAPKRSRGKRSKPAPIRQGKAAQRRAPEQLLIEAVPEIHEQRVLCTSLGQGRFAAAVATEHPECSATCFYLDIYLAEQARRAYADGPANLAVHCAADLPTEETDVVAFPLPAGGEAELARDFMQAGYLALRNGGRMLTASNDPRDKWLHEQMQSLFPKVTRRDAGDGVVYLGTKKGPLKKIKNFESEFAFRDQGRLIRTISRPGVFSHRRLDGGARALMNTMEVRAGDRVVDMGCGSGAVSFAAALRAEGVHVQAVDSNARAVSCTRRGAELNGLERIQVKLDAEGQCDNPGTHDLFVCNPPYFSHYRISEIFLQSGVRALKPRGMIQVVAKHVDWYLERMPELFDDVAVVPSGEYRVVTGRRRNR